MAQKRMINLGKNATSSQEGLKIGTINPPNDNTRDAIHVAVIQVTAGNILGPGTHVRIENGLAYSCGHARGVGIVDPFATESAKKGDRFWLFLYPGSITSLKHVWTHPEFEYEANNEKDIQKAVIWIRDFAFELGMTYDEILHAATKKVERGEYHVFGYDTPDGAMNEYLLGLFWEHYETVTGKKPPVDKYFFSCAC